MIPAGSRLLLGATVVAIIGAVAYGVSVSGSLGTTGLITAATALAFLAGLVLYTRDADVSSMDPTAATESAAARPAPPSSVWPIVGALGGVLVVVGLVTYPVVFVFGIIALVATTVEWMVSAWAERASADRHFNAGVRQRLSHPAEFPVLALLAAAVIIYSFSRIMLFLSKTSGPVAFGVVAALALIAGFVVAFRPQLPGTALSAVAGIAVVGLVAGGVASALAGERDIERHHTTAEAAAEGECATAEELHSDENASQNVAAKANILAEITLKEDGTLVARALGLGESTHLFVQRANVTNVRFRNETEEDRRLVLNLGERAAVDEATEETIPGETVAVQHCTALVEEGGSQFMTFSIPESSSADNEYTFTVPGVDDGQAIEVIVP
jgi:hypothetical protein